MADLERKPICEMSPTEFERCCLDILSGYAEEEGLKDFTIKHNKIICAPDDRYQIDVYTEFTALGSHFRVLCECKRYKNRVNREKVAVLHQKLKSIGAQKGILISTSDFQSGAIEYAIAHGIALIKVEDYHFEYLSHSIGQKEDDNDPFLYAEKHMPPYVGIACTTASGSPSKVFPTRAMIKKLYEEMNQQIREKMWIDISIDFPDLQATDCPASLFDPYSAP